MKKFIKLVVGLALILSFLPSTLMVEANTQKDYYSILFKNNSIPQDFKGELDSLGGEIVYSVPEIGYVQVKAPKAAFAKVKGLNGVSAANPSITWSLPQSQKIKEDVVTPAKAALWDLQWDIKRITNNGESYKLGTGSHDVVVGVIDTGIDRDHPDLVGNLLPGSKNFVPAGGFQGTEPEETGNPDAFDDLNGHGSHVAGSIAANGGMLGVAPDTGIKAYRVFGKSSAESGWIFAAMIAAANDGVDVISMSLGGFDIIGQAFYVDPVTGEKINLGNDVADFKAYKRAVDYALSKGSLVVAASGNDGINISNKNEVLNFLNNEYAGDGLYFNGAGFAVPATLPGVVTVSATGPNDQFASYSNYGEGVIDITTSGGDSRMYVDYYNTGRFNEYIAKRLYEKEFNLSTSEDGGYYWSTGTSMATPKVSAVAALLIDKYGKMSPAQLEQLLYKVAVDTIKGTDIAYFGNGFLNAYKALQ